MDQMMERLASLCEPTVTCEPTVRANGANGDSLPFPLEFKQLWNALRNPVPTFASAARHPASQSPAGSASLLGHSALLVRRNLEGKGSPARFFPLPSRNRHRALHLLQLL